MELFCFKELCKLHHVFGAVVVDPEGAPGGVLAEIDVGGAVKHRVGILEQRMVLHRLRIEVDHVAFDDLDRLQNPGRQLGAAVEFAFAADDLSNPFFCALDGGLASETDDFAILPFSEQCDNKRAADQTGDSGQKDLFHPNTRLFFLYFQLTF